MELDADLFKVFDAFTFAKTGSGKVTITGKEIIYEGTECEAETEYPIRRADRSRDTGTWIWAASAGLLRLFSRLTQGEAWLRLTANISRFMTGRDSSTDSMWTARRCLRFTRLSRFSEGNNFQ